MGIYTEIPGKRAREDLGESGRGRVLTSCRPKFERLFPDLNFLLSYVKIMIIGKESTVALN
jgi:hypothetical protein